MAKKKLDPARCSEMVSDRDSRWPTYLQCRRKPWKDGKCKQHHAGERAKRAAKRRAEWAIKDANIDFNSEIECIGWHVLGCVEGGRFLDAFKIRKMAEDAIRKRDEAIAKAKGE